MKKSLIALLLSLVFLSGLCGESSPNGYQFQHDWQYYANFSPANSLDHLELQITNYGGYSFNNSSVQTNSDNFNLYINTSGYAIGMYYFKFRVGKLVNNIVENQGSYTHSSNLKNQPIVFNLPAQGKGTFTISFDFYNLEGAHCMTGYHTFEKINATYLTFENSNHDILYKIRSSDSLFRRPMLCVEGFDPVNAKGVLFYQSLITSIEDISSSAFCDVELYFLNFRDAMKDMRENAMVVLGAINYLGSLYQSETYKEGISVLGVSMGGVVSRYALAYAEEYQITHRCSQLITYDSPHSGAVLNTNLQDEIYDTYEDITSIEDAIESIETWSWALGIIPGLVVNLVTSDFNDSIDDYKEMFRPLLNTIEAPASKQLLRYNVNSEQYTDEINGSLDFRNFYSEINLEERLAYNPSIEVLNNDPNYPNNKPGYPFKQNAVKSIAISNGSITQSGDSLDEYDHICYLNIPSLLYSENIYIDEEEWETQPGSTLGLSYWAENADSLIHTYYDPVFVPLKSSLHLKTIGENNSPNNDNLVINNYADIIPIDINQVILTDHNEIASYLANHSFFDVVAFSSTPNLRHDSISYPVVQDAISQFNDPLNRAISTISGSIVNTDLTDVQIRAYIGQNLQQLNPEHCVLLPDGRWIVAYTLLQDTDIVIEFSKAGCIPTIKKFHIDYNESTCQANSFNNVSARIMNLNLQDIRVSSSDLGSFNSIGDALDYLITYFSTYPYNNEAIRIRVLPGTYSESVDLSPLAALGITNFTLEGVGETIINGDSYGVKLVTDIDSACSGAVYNIMNLKITGSVRGVTFKDSWDELSGDVQAPQLTLNINNCTIYDCGSSSYSGTGNPIFSAAAIHFEGAGSITNCHLYDNVMTTSSDTYSQYCQAGGLFVNNNTTSDTEIAYNIFTNNTGALSGGLVAKGKGNILIRNNEFCSNTYSWYCDIYNAYEANALSVYDASNIVINNNLFVDNIPSSIPYGAVIGLTTYVSQAASPIKFLNNTIVNSPQYSNNGLSAIKFRINAGVAVQDIQVKNNIISSTNNNGCTIDSGAGYSPVSINYNILHNTSLSGFSANLYNPDDPNSVYNSTAPRFNYQCDPQLAANYIPTWNTTTMSHCIDTGTGVNDSDGTPPDIGAFRATDHRYWQYRFRSGQNDRSDTYHWVSYPVVNSLTQGKTVARSFFHELLGTHENANNDVVADVLQEILWSDIEGQKVIRWNVSGWGPYVDTHNVVSPQGYKVKLLSVDNSGQTPTTVELHHSGFLTPDNTPFMIYGSASNGGQTYENWIGYFDTESVWPTDAFASIWNDITMIKAKDWCLYRDPNSSIGAIIGKMLPINCGDMVIVTTVNDHEFQWDTTIPTDPKKKEVPTAFEYVEKADYTPVYIDLSGVDMSDLKEIGLKLDGICKGAVVVTDSLEQICAYLDDGESLSSGLVELVFFYESKSQPMEMRSVAINDTQLSSSIIGDDSAYPVYNIKVTSADLSNTVVPVLSLEQNYPNPFNPTTSIRYSINEPGSVSLDIYNVKGQLVKTLYQGNAEIGSHTAIWNGLDNSGNACSSGVYFYRLRTPKTSLVRKMLMLK
ncbi:MAG: T9SS type A sorting domain-containing protein [Candidatus Cloacimonetes bacterium]